MAHFRTRLTLDSLDDRLVPSTVTPADPGGGPAANVANATPYVVINTDPMSHATQLHVQVEGQDGSVHSVYVDIPAGSSPATAAALIAAALQADGVSATANGSVVNMQGVERVDVQVTGSDLGRDNPGIQPPDVTGYNGATGTKSVNLQTQS